MHITRAQWLGLASERPSLRRMYSLCLLIDRGDTFSYRERRLAGRLIARLETVVHLPLAANDDTRGIADDFTKLEAQVTKRLERLAPPRR